MSYPTEDEIVDLDKIDGPIWNQHPEESDKNYAHFCAFRDLGRQRTKLQSYLNYKGKSREEHGKDSAPSMTYAWSKKFCWEERAEAWDQHMDNKRQEEMEQEMVDYSKTMMKNTQIVGDSVLKGLKSRLEGKDPNEVEEILFEDDNLTLEGISRTLATIKSVASEAYGQLSEEEDDDGNGILETIEKAVKDD